MAHGEGFNKRSLDRQSAEDLKLHKADLKVAEKEVFGHFLAPKEWEKLSDKEKKVKSEQMMEIVKERIAIRYNQSR